MPVGRAHLRPAAPPSRGAASTVLVEVLRFGPLLMAGPHLMPLGRCRTWSAGSWPIQHLLKNQGPISGLDFRVLIVRGSSPATPESRRSRCFLFESRPPVAGLTQARRRKLCHIATRRGRLAARGLSIPLPALDHPIERRPFLTSRPAATGAGAHHLFARFAGL